MMTSLRCADIRISVWSGHSCLRLGLCRRMTGGENGGPLTFRFDKHSLDLPVPPVFTVISRLAVICTSFVPNLPSLCPTRIANCTVNSWHVLVVLGMIKCFVGVVTTGYELDRIWVENRRCIGQYTHFEGRTPTTDDHRRSINSLCAASEL